MKRIFITFVLSLLGIISYAQDFEVEGIYYNYSKEDPTECVITYNGEKYYSGEPSYTFSSIRIPKTVTFNGTTYNVTSIGEGAFLNCSSLNKVIIPEAIERIGNKAFYGCFFTYLEEGVLREDTLICEGAVPPVCDMAFPNAAEEALRYNTFTNYCMALFLPNPKYREAYDKEPWNSLVKLPDSYYTITGITDFEVPRANISIEGSLISCPEKFKLYNILGQDVSNKNGTLQKGVYIIATNKSSQKVLVK